MSELITGILLPFLGTCSGGAGVFLFGNAFHKSRGALSCFASGIMVAACVWSLIIPALEEKESSGRLAFLPVAISIIAGFLVMWAAESSLFKKRSGDKLFFAMTLHNIPEGMAVGMLYSAFLSGQTDGTSALAFALAVALQNIPEGAVAALPYFSRERRFRCLVMSALSGIVEPIGAIAALTVSLAAGKLLPYLLSLCAGVMLYVSFGLVGEQKSISGKELTALALGFTLMMSLDVALGQ